MNAITSIAQSGLQLASLGLASSAHNIANVATQDFHRQQLHASAQAGGGVTATISTAEQPGEALATDLVDGLSAGYVFNASLKAIETEQQMLGSLLDARA